MSLDCITKDQKLLLMHRSESPENHEGEAVLLCFIQKYMYTEGLGLALGKFQPIKIAFSSNIFIPNSQACKTEVTCPTQRMRPGIVQNTSCAVGHFSLIPRPLPDFISQLWRKIGRRPGIKTTSRTRMVDSVSTNRVHVTY